MVWNASLTLDYTRQGGRIEGQQDGCTVARFLHSGPLRILQSLYPEGAGICHNVIVHPPGGLVGGDRLDVQVSVGGDAHGLVTTPGATRFYRSEGAAAVQQAQITLAGGARLEWLPMETICYSGCLAENRLAMQLAPGSELIGWDITALGLPAAGQPFAAGSLLQHLELCGAWLERGHIRALDQRLLSSPLGLAGQRCIASLFFAAGEPLAVARRQELLDVARSVIDAHPLRASTGATCPNAQVVVVRALAPLVEPAMQLMQAVRAAWRQQAWHLAAERPRSWAQ